MYLGYMFQIFCTEYSVRILLKIDSGRGFGRRKVEGGRVEGWKVIKRGPEGPLD